MYDMSRKVGNRSKSVRMRVKEINYGRCSDKSIDRVQNYYGKAIRDNKNNLEGIRTIIKTIDHHITKRDTLSLCKQHSCRPKSSDTWCKYWKAQNEKAFLYNENNRLHQVFKNEIEPKFTRLSNHYLLTRCLKWMTENQNEAADGILSCKCPKTKFYGARKMIYRMQNFRGKAIRDNKGNLEEMKTRIKAIHYHMIKNMTLACTLKAHSHSHLTATQRDS